LRLKFSKTNIVTFGELFLKPSDTIKPESTTNWTLLNNDAISQYKSTPTQNSC